MIQPVILCGGAGTRLWPLSREHHPKPLHAVNGERTLLQETALRCAAEPLVVCNESHRFLVQAQLRRAAVRPRLIMLESAGRGTAPALTLAAVHAVTADDPVGQLKNELQHYSYRDLSDHLDRINRYSTLAAHQMHESGRRAGPVDLLLHPPAAFVRNYVLRGGFADGMAGLTLSLINAYSVLLKFAKLWELQHRTPNSQSPTPKI